jgi:phytanoyl-CoA dioxygenase PhyH
MREIIEERGFAIEHHVIGLVEIEKLLEGVDDANLPRSRAGIRHAMKHAGIAQLAWDSRLLGMARAVLGDETIPFRATLFDKSHVSNWLVVWHQDTALPLRVKRETEGWGPWSVKDGITYAHAPAHALSRVLALRLHLDDSKIENGPLRVLPGTHTLGVLTDDQLHDLSERVASVDCMVEQGGVLAIRPLLVHASSKSRSELPRRVLHIEYGAAVNLADGMELEIT